MAKLPEREQQRIVDVYLETKSQKETARITCHSTTTVWRCVNKAGLGCGIGGNQESQRKITDEQILSCIDTMTRQEIADKYGVHVENLARRMKKLGVHAIYATPKRGKYIVKNADEWHWTQRCSDFVERCQHGRFELVEFKRDRVRMRCKECGTIVERNRSTIRERNISCDGCKLKEKRKREEEKAVRKLGRFAELEKPKKCRICGEIFYSEYENQQYCSQKCKKRAKRTSSYRSRAKKYGVIYESGITLQKVYERDHGICQICGGPVDWDDHSWNGYIGPNYPTIDHIKALANGGGHTWDNVQLAHAMCNSCKRDLITA